MRVALAAAIFLGVASVTSATDVRAAVRQQTNIAAQDLAPALKMLAKDHNIQLVYRSELVKDQRTGGAAGDLTFEEALTQLLSGTGLTYNYLQNNAITIVPVQPAQGEGPAAHGAAAALSEGQAGYAYPSRMRLAMTSPSDSGASTASAGQAADAGADSSDKVEEVIVTAQKHQERSLDVPVPVTAINAQDLVNNNQLRLQDYYSSVPGLSLTPSIMSGNTLSIRGITTGGISNPTVGVVVDDVPYGASSGSSGMIVPDLDPGDLAQVEVLRGPQGALYGASSMGGLLKFVTVDPSTDALHGRVEAGTDFVHNADDPGYNFRGSVNVPISDTFAMRASGFTRRDPGYIDSPILGIDGINQAEISGGRLAGLWRPSDVLSVKLSALYQQSNGDGSNNVDLPVNGYAGPPLGDLEQNYVRGVGAYQRKVQAYSATVNAKAGIFDLVSVTGYNINSYDDSFDFSSIFGPTTELFFGEPGAPSFAHAKVNKFTQEFRFSAPIASRVTWQFGLFYTDERTTSATTIDAADPLTGAIAAQVSGLQQKVGYDEYAAFTTFTFQITDPFDVQIGGRASDIKQSQAETDTSAVGPPITVLPELDSTAHAYTYLLTPRYKITPDLMVYARLASGYRPGGPNVILANVPAQSDPDKTQDSEIGIKGELFQRALTYDASVYNITWKDIQLPQVDLATGRSYVANGGRAKSQGVEFSVDSRPLPGLTASAWVTYDNAELTEDLPPSPISYGKSGDRLPYSSRISGNLSLQQEFAITSNVSGFAGGAVSYVGDRQGTLAPPATRQDYPGYAKIDLRSGAKFEDWTLNVFITNLADRRGLLTGGNGFVPAYAFNYIEPRTIGLSIAKTF